MTDELQTRILKVNPSQPEQAIIATAAAALQQGQLVAFPTETVYGLGANAFDSTAIRRIFTAKGRPMDNPLIAHVTTADALYELVATVPPAAVTLIERFWPGPLTLVCPRAPQVPAVVSAGLATVAVRMPAHPVALALIKAAGVPVVAPSANTSGRPSPTTAAHVADDLSGKIEFILDGGQTGIGVESTVLDLTGTVPVLLRPGGITLEELKDVIGEVTVDPALRSGGASTQPPRAPGMKYTHYAPRAPLFLVAGPGQAKRAKIAELVHAAQAQGKRVGVLVTAENAPYLDGDFVAVVGTAKDLRTVAANLYAKLREFDAAKVDVIFAEGFNETGWGLTVMNRLKKAAGYKIITVDS